MSVLDEDGVTQQRQIPSVKSYYTSSILTKWLLFLPFRQRPKLLNKVLLKHFCDICTQHQRRRFERICRFT